MIVYYDEQCPICRKSRRLIESIERKPVQWVPLESAEACGLDPESCFEQIHVEYRGKIYKGFYALRLILWQTRFYFLVPLLYIPGVSWLGQKCYLFIAKRRYRFDWE
ncbi:MAG: DUF393 domain-containing protein [Bacillaceae bacterium]|nr:DUF393 domain-containing protein [Bacillaceae bacterium]